MNCRRSWTKRRERQGRSDESEMEKGGMGDFDGSVVPAASGASGTMQSGPELALLERKRAPGTASVVL